MTTRPTRTKDKPLTRGEVAGLMKRGYVRPIPEPLPLHVMARRRIVTAGSDSQAGDSTPSEGNGS